MSSESTSDNMPKLYKWTTSWKKNGETVSKTYEYNYGEEIHCEDCNCMYTRSNKSRHFKTKKHQKNVLKNIPKIL